MLRRKACGPQRKDNLFMETKITYLETQRSKVEVSESESERKNESEKETRERRRKENRKQDMEEKKTGSKTWTDHPPDWARAGREQIHDLCEGQTSLWQREVSPTTETGHNGSGMRHWWVSDTPWQEGHVSRSHGGGGSHGACGMSIFTVTGVEFFIPLYILSLPSPSSHLNVSVWLVTNLLDFALSRSKL